MTRRPAVTLMEVLIAMLIMAIGLLSLLVLFPLGAISMGQALKDDRCASTAAMAGNVADATDIRHDPNVWTAKAVTGHHLVYVDPEAVTSGLTTALGGLIPRISPSFAQTPQLADRWFSLPDDITFSESGTADTITTGGIVDRGRRYSYAYLLRDKESEQKGLAQMGNQQSILIDLHVVVYHSRPIGALTAEPTYTALGTPALLGTVGQNNIKVFATGYNPWPPEIKRGHWILDPVNGSFYRVTNIEEIGGIATVEVQQPLADNITLITVMPYVSEVFDKGTGFHR